MNTVFFFRTAEYSKPEVYQHAVKVAIFLESELQAADKPEVYASDRMSEESRTCAF